MSIKFDPRITGLIPRSGLGEAAGPDAGKAGGKKRDYLRAMEKPRLLATPQDAATKPAPGKRTGEVPRFQQQATALLGRLRKASATERPTVAQEAILAAASYAMRRSKGSRRMGLDLLEAVSEADPDDETAALASKLRYVLLAEAYLHEASPESTLRAVRALVGMLEDEGEGTA
jgi:hypothetical protein